MSKTDPSASRSKRAALAAGVAAAALLAAGCGGSGSSSGQGAAPASSKGAEANPAGDIPDNQAYVPFKLTRGGFSVKVPEGWSRSASAGGATFTDKLNSIRLESRPAGRALTEAAARRTEVPKLAGTIKGFASPKVTTVTRKAGPAVRIAYLATAKANAVSGKTGRDAVERYVFFRKGTEAILVLSGPKGADNVDPWRIVTDSLRWTP